jgi:hypothetical protein
LTIILEAIETTYLNGEPLLTTNASIKEPDCTKWDLYNSVFFSFTAITTIGMSSNRLTVF